jgi:hypothetical protein
VGIDGDAGDFAKMDVRREFQEVRDGVVGDFGRLLGEKRSGCKKKQDEERALHEIAPHEFEISLFRTRIIRGFAESVAC